MAASSTIFWVFGMTRPGIEPRSLGPLANIHLIGRMSKIWNLITDMLYKEEKGKKIYINGFFKIPNISFRPRFDEYNENFRLKGFWSSSGGNCYFKFIIILNS